MELLKLVEYKFLKMSFRLLFYSVLFLLSNLCIAQYNAADWKVHVPYNQCESIAISPNRVYAYTNNGLFYISKNDKSVEVITKIDGLSNSEFKSIAYDNENSQLVIGYANGTIDLYTDESVFTITDITRSNVIGSKTINHIGIQDNIAVLSCDFGVVLIDLINRQVKESYINIGENGTSIPIYSSAFLGTDSLYILTEEGLKGASLLPQYILQDKNNWTHIDLPVTGGNRYLATLNTKVYVPIDESGVYAFSNGSWELTAVPQQTTYNVISPSGDKLFIVGTQDIYSFDGNTITQLVLNASYSPKMCLEYDDEVVFTSTWGGIVFNKKGSNEFERLFPDGPSHNDIYKIVSINGDVYSLPGSRYRWSGTKKNRVINLYRDNNWTTRTTDATSLTDLIFDEQRSAFFLCSMGYGVRKYDSNFELLERYNDTTGNAPFINALDLEAEGRYLNYTKVTEVRQDYNNDLWFINTETRGNDVLHKLNSDETWESFRPTGDDANYIVELEIDKGNNKWMHIEGPKSLNKLLVYNESTGNQYYLTNGAGQGDLPDAVTNDITIDLDDNIWCATNTGVAVFYNASEAFSTGSTPKATLPIFEGRPLLEDEIVNCLKVDGANRKWFGTNNGVFLFEDNGTENLLQFNIDNSPLLSNTIITIGINDVTGEVFFGTDKGIVSYSGDASIGLSTHQVVGHNELKIFPNPVLPDFEGSIRITGLVRDAQVKITDVTGRVVYENSALGGMLSWDGNAENGERVATGVYLVFSTNDEGSETFVGKIAVVK